MIPDSIRRPHVEAALAEIADRGVPPERRSTRYCLEEENVHYAPKFVVSIAGRFADGSEVDHSNFNGGGETNGYLRQRGFTVIECRCGGNPRERGRAIRS